jgi:Kef-type K+ transport system membrane component KefB
MFKVTRDFLPILGLEVDVKRLFNISRDILGLRQTSMGVETLRAFVTVLAFHVTWSRALARLA